jgi:prolyl-tRNA synthetase
MAVKRTGEKTSIDLASVAAGVTRVFAEITDTIRARAEENTKSRLCNVGSMGNLVAALDEGRVAVVHWCQHRECGDAIETGTNASILGTDVRSQYVPVAKGPCVLCGKPGKPTLVGRAY